MGFCFFAHFLSFVFFVYDVYIYYSYLLIKKRKRCLFIFIFKNIFSCLSFPFFHCGCGGGWGWFVLIIYYVIEAHLFCLS